MNCMTDTSTETTVHSAAVGTQFIGGDKGSRRAGQSSPSVCHAPIVDLRKSEWVGRWDE